VDLVVHEPVLPGFVRVNVQDNAGGLLGPQLLERPVARMAGDDREVPVKDQWNVEAVPPNGLGYSVYRSITDPSWVLPVRLDRRQVDRLYFQRFQFHEQPPSPSVV